MLKFSCGVVNTYILGTLSDDDDGNEKVYLGPIKCQMQATFPGVEFLRILLRFKKRKEDSSSYVHVLHKT